MLLKKKIFIEKFYCHLANLIPVFTLLSAPFWSPPTTNYCWNPNLPNHLQPKIKAAAMKTKQ